MEQLKRRLGDPYGVGVHKYAPVGSPVSCSGLLYSARQDAGLGNPVWGTYGYANWIGANNTARPYDGKPDKPAGMIFVATSGAGGPDGTHMSISIGGGQVIESVFGAGVRTARQPGSFGGVTPLMGEMPDIGTSAGQAFGEAAGEAAGAAGDFAANLVEGISTGILKALLTVAGFIYGYLILRLLDFWGGFGWELTSKLIGELAPWLEEVDLIKIATGQADAGDMAELPEITPGGLVLDDEALNRLFFILFGIFSYQLAWGRDSSGNHRLDSLTGGLGNLSNVDLQSKRAKNTRATLEAEVVGELVERGHTPERARTFARKEIQKMNDAELRKETQSIMARLRAEKMPKDDRGRFKVIEGGKGKPAQKTLEDDAIEELVKLGVPRERAERTVRRGNVRTVEKASRES